jgi:uncharacterized protein YndB with AHSA1/START domain
MTDRERTAIETAAQGFEITREFDAPRELVFKAWTEPERLAQWWGPAGASIQVVSFDLRPEGVFHYLMQTSDGDEMRSKFTFREIVAPERLVFTSAFSDEQGNTVRAPISDTWPLEILDTLTFTEHEGRTTLHLHSVPVNPSDAEQEMFDSFAGSMEQGFGSSFEKLDAYLEQAQA